MPNSKALSPDSTAERTALWRACICKPMRRPMSSRTTSACGCWPADSWRQRPDMDPVFTRTFRASMVARRVSWKTWCWNRPPRASRST